MNKSKKILKIMIALSFLFGVCYGEDKVDNLALKEEFSEAERYYVKGNYAAAREVLQKLTTSSKKKNNYRIRLLAACEYKLGNLKEAESLYEISFKNGSEEALKGLALVKLSRGDLDWLHVNKDSLENRLKIDVDVVRVFAIWAMKEKDLRLLEFGMSRVTDEALSKHPNTSKTVLQVYRYFFTNLLKQNRAKRK